MELDRNYKKSIPTELRCTYSEEPTLKERMHGYDGPGPCLNFASNLFNNPLDLCTVARSLNRDFMSNLTFNSNQYVKRKLSPIALFCRMVWKNISMTVVYMFLGILLKMSFDVEGYISLWYSPTNINISPTCQIKVNDDTG